MNVADTLAMSWTNLRRRKGRSALTAAGVIVGVAALVLMVSLGLGLQRQVLQLFETEDELRTLHVTRVSADTGKKKSNPFLPFQMGGQVVPLTDKELAEIQAIPGVELAYPDLDMFLRFRLETPAGTHSIPLAPAGAAHPDEEQRYRRALVAGTLWRSDADRACLLPKPLLDFRLGLKPEEVLGGKVTFGGNVEEGEGPSDAMIYTCVGVFDSEKIGLRGRKIILPSARALELRELTRGGAFSFIPFKKGTYAAANVRVSDPKAAGDVARRVRSAGYEVLSALDLIKSINLIFLVVEGLMGCIGAIGLIVSLFGIANTMAMAVLERSREIGIMKALGARNRDIGRLFLAEAAAIGALGGAVGLGAGVLVGHVLNAVALQVLDMPPHVSLFHVSPWLAAGSVAFSIFVSVLAGTLPARRAARMEPVAALRYE